MGFQVLLTDDAVHDLEDIYDYIRRHDGRGKVDHGLIFFKPHRIIYRVIENSVYVLLIADGRRDMQTLLKRRLLQP